VKKNQQYTPVRFSHLIGYAGVGSIIRDHNDFLMAVTDIRYWKDAENNEISTPIQNINQVKRHLKINKELRIPPTAQINNEELIGNAIPAVIFPSYAMCKNCNRLHHKPWSHSSLNISNDLLCDNCKKSELEQVTWCAVSSYGDLMDVPWHYICHKTYQGKCEIDYSRAYLEIITSQRGKQEVRCTLCGSSHSFLQENLSLKGDFQPWITKYRKEGEEKIFTVMEVNDPRVYGTKKSSAIVIPPESNLDKNSLRYKLTGLASELKQIQDEEDSFIKSRLMIPITKKYRCTKDEIMKVINEINNSNPEPPSITDGEMYSDEFNALISEESYNEGADFVTEHKTEAWKAYLEELKLEGELSAVANLIEKVVAVNRLRVIEVFKGFSRSANDDSEEDIIVYPDIDGSSSWLPAIELFGEGIFFTITPSILDKWENSHEIRLRADEISKRYENSTVQSFENLPKISPRFLLLHTLSHLIIRELEITSGYSSASLKERIYHSQNEKMAGILIYTAAADISGTLGGIIESIDPKNFLKLLDGALKHAQWCSLDPVCTEHEGQGPGWLNRAACHACSLIPETSCEYNNVFLDRVFIKGNEQLNIPSILINKREH